MQTVKLSIFIACSMGIISTITDLIAPDDSMKKQFMSMLGLISLLAVLSPWLSDGFTLSLETDLDEQDILFYTENAENELEQLYLESAENEYDAYLLELLNNNDIKAASVDTYMTLSENDEVTVENIVVKLYDLSQENSAYSLMNQQLPEADIQIMAVEDERTDQNISGQPETSAG